MEDQTLQLKTILTGVCLGFIIIVKDGFTPAIFHHYSIKMILFSTLREKKKMQIHFIICTQKGSSASSYSCWSSFITRQVSKIWFYTWWPKSAQQGRVLGYEIYYCWTKFKGSLRYAVWVTVKVSMQLWNAELNSRWRRCSQREIIDVVMKASYLRWKSSDTWSGNHFLQNVLFKLWLNKWGNSS